MRDDIDLALEPRVMFDGAAAADAADDTLITPTEDNIDGMDQLPLPPEPVTETVEVYVVDMGIPEADQLIAGLPEGATIIQIPENVNGVEYLAKELSHFENIDALHILSHGEAGKLHLGSSAITLGSMLGDQAKYLEQIGMSLSENGDILIYGCDFAAGDAGALAASTFATLTGADVAASDDLTGAAEQDANWTLEFSAGEVEAVAFASAAFTGVLSIEATDGLLTIRDSDDPTGTITITDNGDPYQTTNISTPRGVEFMAERVWQYTETNDRGQATLVFDVSTLAGDKGTIASDYGIILSTSADLSTDPLVLRASGFDAANNLVFFHNVNLADDIYIGLASQTEVDNISIDPVVVIDEEGVADLNLVVQPDLTDGGTLPDTFATAVGYRAEGSATPTGIQIPAGTTNITITGYSNEPGDTNQPNDRNDDYQTLNVSIDLSSNTSSGTIAYIVDRGPNRNDQFAWSGAPLGTDVLSGAMTITGNTGSNISPTFEIMDGELLITENHGLQTSYLVEFQTTLNSSANFLGSAAGLADIGDTSDIVIDIPAGVDVIKINQTDAAAGSNFAIEYKGFSKHYIDVADGIASGATMAQRGETDGRVSAFAYEDYTLGSGDVVGNAGFVTGDTASTVGSTNNLQYDIVGNQLIIKRDAAHAANFNSLFTVEFYEQLDLGSSADILGESSDQTVFDASNGTGEEQLDFVVPEGAQLGILNLSLGGTRNSNTNENTGGAFVLIDLSNGTTSGSFFTVRVSNTVDLLSWESIPFDTTIFDEVTGDPTSGEASSNHSSLNQFRDEYAARARFEISTNARGEQVVSLITDSQDGNATFLDYNAFGQVQWLGSEPIRLTGVPAEGSFNIGGFDANGDYVIDIQEAADQGLFFTPPEHRSGPIDLALTVSVGPETDETQLIIRPIIDPVTFDTVKATGDEDTQIALGALVQPTLIDDDGSETITSTVLSDLTVGHTVSDGTNSFTATAGNTSVDVSSWNLSALTYQGGPNESGDFTFTVTVNNQDTGAGQTVVSATSTSETVTVCILPINDPPIPMDETYSAVVATPLVIPTATGVLANETDPENDTLTATLLTGPASGTLIFNADGSFTYTGATAGSVTFTYQISDGNGNTETATATINVDAAPPLPPFAADETRTTNEDTPIIIDALTNDTVNSAGVTFGTGANSPQNGSVVQNPDGTFTYTPDPDFNGTDSFQYTLTNVSGSSTATVTINVTPVNDAPVALPEAFTTPEDTPITIPASANDSDVDGDSLFIENLVATNGIVSMVTDGTYVFTPDPGFSGVATVTYNVRDRALATDADNLTSNTVTTTINVSAELDAPDSADRTITTLEDTPYVIQTTDIAFTDQDVNDELQSVRFEAPTTGTLLINGVPVTTFPVTVSAMDLGNGLVSYLPPLDATGAGVGTIDFTVNDGQLDDLAPNTLTFDVTAVNDPIALLGAELPDVTVKDGDVGVSIPTAGRFGDVDNIITNFAATVRDQSGAAVTLASLGLSIDTTTGEITGTIDNTASANSPYSIEITATSADGTMASDAFLLTSTNPVPTATPGGTVILNDGDMGISIPVDSLFVDPDGDALTITQFSGSGSVPGNLVYNPASGRLEGNIAANASDVSQTYTVVFQAVDAQGAATTTSISFVVENPAPTLVAPLVNQSSIDNTTIAPLDLSAFFVDDDSLTFSVTGLPQGLMVDANGLVTGTLDNSASQGGVQGAYTVVVTATDTQGDRTEASFTWTVTNPEPILANPPAQVQMQDTQTFNVPLSNIFNDVDGDDLTFSFTEIGGASVGTVSVVNIGGQPFLQITANGNASQIQGGLYMINITADDGEGGTATTQLDVMVTNPPPVFDQAIGNQTNNDLDVISLDISQLFDDVDNDTVVLTQSGLSALGLSLSGTTITGTIDSSASQSSPFPITITATDADGGVGTYSFDWIVNNPVPTANDIADQTGQDGTTLAIPLPGIFADADGGVGGDTLSYTVSSDSPDIGALNITVIGGVPVVGGSSGPNASQGGINSDGVYQITVTATDTDGASVDQTFDLTISNIPPVSTGLPDQTAIDGQDFTGANALNLATLGGFMDGIPDADALTFSTTSTLPPGLNNLTNDGILSGTLDHLASANSPYVITVVASDSQGGTVSESFVFNVSNPAPMVVAMPQIDISVVNTDMVSLNLADSFMDADGANAGGMLDDLTYTASGLPNGLMIDPNTGAISGTVNDVSGQGYPVFVTITDEQDASATHGFVINIENTAPSVATPIANQSHFDGAAITTIDLNSVFTDPDPTTSLIFTLDGILPPGLTFASGMLSGTLDNSASQELGSGGQAGIFTLTARATDGFGATAVQAFVIDVRNIPPTADPIADQMAMDSVALSLDVAALGNFTDAGPGSTDSDDLTFSAINLPPWLSISSAGVLTGTPPSDESADSPIPIAVTADDGEGGTVTRVFNLIVNNPAPQSIALPNVTAADGETVTIPTAGGFNDPDGDILTFSTTSPLPDGLMLNSTTGEITGQVGNLASAVGTYSVTIIATDAQGATAETPFEITITNPGPVAMGIPDLTFPDGTDFSGAGALDLAALGGIRDGGLDSDELEFNATTPLPPGLSLSPFGVLEGAIDNLASDVSTYPITLEVVDSQDQAILVSFLFNVTNPAPVGTAIPDVAFQDGDMVNLPVIGGFSDPDGDDLTFNTTSTLPAGLSFDPTTGVITGQIDNLASDMSPYSITIRATDEQGAFTETTFTITVTNPAPVAQSLPNVLSEAGLPIDPIDTSPQFSDLDGDRLVFAATGLPPGLMIDANTGIISGAPDASLIPGTEFAINVIVIDENGGMANIPFVFVIDDSATQTLSAQSPLGGALGSSDASPVFQINTGTGSPSADNPGAILLDALDEIQDISFFNPLDPDQPILSSVESMYDLTRQLDEVNAPIFTHSFPITFALNDGDASASDLTANVLIGDTKVLYQIEDLAGRTVKLDADTVPAGVLISPEGILLIDRWVSAPFQVLVEVQDGTEVTVLEITIDPQKHLFEVHAKEVRALLLSERLNWTPALN